MEKILFGIAKQWIAGDTIDDALKSSKLSYKNGRHAIVNKKKLYPHSENGKFEVPSRLNQHK